MSQERDALLERARTHIKAVMTEIKDQQPGQLAQPAGLFMSGMITGLAAGVEILGGGTAEQSLETVHTRLAAAIGEAYIAGTLPTTPPATDTDGQPTRAEEIRELAAAISGLTAAIREDIADRQPPPVCNAPNSIDTQHCELVAGHEGRHVQGISSWPRKGD
ncbi:hypothetical protein [Streptomyces sp. NPDC046909]|uniref:hypothetical protein n=1 Tax=Streptomyces sp. NPDC046909 TaxID=3155617 RepID=UPI0033F3503D